MLACKQRIKIGKVANTVVGKAVAAKSMSISVEHYVICSLWHSETVAFIRTVGREIEHEHERTSHICQHLVAIIMPYLLHGELA